MNQRVYPQFGSTERTSKPLSFVTVRYSPEFEHNLATSPCVNNPLNELIVVDNQANVVHDTLCGALCSGVARARNDLVVIVHEDVVLLGGWQARFEQSLDALERVDPDWCVLGAAGWTRDLKMRGHWSDPHGYFDLLGGQPFAEVSRIDEHLMVLRRTGAVALDPLLPSIHNIGQDLANMGHRVGRRSYVIDAPTIHKYADANGSAIGCASDSPKIRARSTLTYKADKSLSDDYLSAKWRLAATPGQSPAPAPVPSPTAHRRTRPGSKPIVLICRGGGGSRLLSQLAQDCGVFLGEELGPAGDSMQMVHAIYRSVLGKYRYANVHSRATIIAELRDAAATMLAGRGEDHPWGFKLPESMLLLDEVAAAFPEARFVHLIRDPLSTTLRRTHMTARLDNQIGQTVLKAAYADLGLSASRILTDSPALHMAITTLFQFKLAEATFTGMGRRQLLVVRFEDLLDAPDAATRKFRSWLDDMSMTRRALAALSRRLTARGHAEREGTLARVVDPDRAARDPAAYDEGVAAQVRHLLAPLRDRLGYTGRT